MTKKEALTYLLFYLKGVSQNASIAGKRGAADFMADRIVQAGTQPTLLSFGEKLASLMGTETSGFFPGVVRNFVATASGPWAPVLLAWLRKHPRIAAQLVLVSAKVKDGDHAAGLDFEDTWTASDFGRLMSEMDVDAVLVDAPQGDDHIIEPPTWQIAITAECRTPLAHGADSKSGNATLFRRMEVLGVNGTVMSLPFYAGNALRGQIRDLLADHLIDALGRPQLALWFFHALYAGGALEEGSTATKALAKRVGDFGTIRAEGIRELRNLLPGLSLLGAALGNKIISGRVMVGDLRPRCREWGTGASQAAALMDWEFLTRRDDNENRASGDDHHGMIATTEVLKVGAVLAGGLNVSDHASETERGSLGLGLELLRARGFLGAENRRGFGQVFMIYQNAPTSEAYESFLNDRMDDIKAYLLDIGAITYTGPAGALFIADDRKTQAKTSKAKGGNNAHSEPVGESADQQELPF